MTYFIETVTQRLDGVVVTQRIRAKSEYSANLAAQLQFLNFSKRGFPPQECWCAECVPVVENDFGETVIVYVNQYSDNARVKEGLVFEVADRG